MAGRAQTVGILGAGTMGAGIAQVAAVGGWTVRLADVDEAAVRRALDTVRGHLDRLVEKKRLDPDERDRAAARLSAAPAPDAFAGCSLLIEAIVERFDAKVEALRAAVAALPDDAIIATNTSSLSISRIGEAIGEPRRTAGMHFFNPAPLMKLVEVVAGEKTAPQVVDRVATIAESWGKFVARAADVAGFIVNHVARPYYLEAFRILEDGCARPSEIDAALRDTAGFRMGPLELTDLIGQDVNIATTRSVWEALGRPPLLAPSLLQERLVADGHLGRKTGRGVYLYEGDEARSALEVRHAPLRLNQRLRRAVDAFAQAAIDETGDELTRYILARVLAALIVQASLAHERGVASRHDIDTALRYGTNYPLGPFEWAERIGADRCAELLDALNETVDDGRFAAPRALRAGA